MIQLSFLQKTKLLQHNIVYKRILRCIIQVYKYVFFE